MQRKKRTRDEEDQKRKRMIFRRRMTDGGVEADAGCDWLTAGCGRISWDYVNIDKTSISHQHLQTSHSRREEALWKFCSGSFAIALANTC